jgi:hypothetical protein
MYPTIIVPCFNHGPNVTHARLTYYPQALFIQYGKLGSRFDLKACEILPLRVYPELVMIHDGERWDLPEVLSMFDLSDEPEQAAVS